MLVPRASNSCAALDTGMVVPSVHVADNLQLWPRTSAILLKGFEVVRGELMPDLETRKKVANLIREWQADIVLSHRPYDYHPDHRAVGNEGRVND